MKRKKPEKTASTVIKYTAKRQGRKRNNCTKRELLTFAAEDPFILRNVIPMLHAMGFTEDDTIRHVPRDGLLAWMILWFSHFMTARGVYDRGSGMLALPQWLLIAYLRKTFTRHIATLKNKAARPLHYEAEKARRQEMAAQRRRVTRRSTVSPCPIKEDLLEAWRHVRDSKESLIRFGSMVQDLECYVDNTLRFDSSGRISGRNSGVKGWLRKNLPELAEHYTSVMRYKAAAKKLRQVVGLVDPTPVTAVFGEISMGEVPSVEVVRARAVYLEVVDGVPDVAARIMARIDALCDPERMDEAATLRSWREKYFHEITVRRKSMWWRRMVS